MVDMLFSDCGLYFGGGSYSSVYVPPPICIIHSSCGVYVCGIYFYFVHLYCVCLFFMHIYPLFYF